jgi:transposase-like protein
MGSHHAPEVRAAVAAALLAGQGVGEVAAQYRLPTSTVSRWKREARRAAGQSEDVGELLLAYLRENLSTLTAQAVVFRDPEWLRTQPAGELAVLHGVMTDKAVRLLEALEEAPHV